MLTCTPPQNGDGIVNVMVRQHGLCNLDLV